MTTSFGPTWLPRLKRYASVGALAFAFSAAPAARAASLQLESATIADLNAAFDKGALTSEKLVTLCLARIEAYEPKLHAVITLNPNALDEARKLDAERKAKGPRSALHGIPVIFKDNFDTADLQTSGGFFGLKGSIPPQDATVVKKLRDAGAIILAKVNLSEFASGGAMSSLGGQSHNPHNLEITPSGSSGGTGVGIAAAYAPLGYGTDTGGSIRGPSTSNGIVGLKPTQGLLSRAGIIPLSLSFDTGGPMARNVTDVAIALGIMTGVDSADAATKKSAGKFEKDYTKYLKTGSLKGARIGVARDFTGKDPEVDRIVNEAVATLENQGATVIDVKYPEFLLQAKGGLSTLIMACEFKAQITDYLKTTKPQYPKTFDELVTRANDPKTHYRSPEKAYALKYTASVALDLNDPIYLAARDQGLALIKSGIDALFAEHKLNAIIYPTSTRPASLITPPSPPSAPSTTDSATSIANATGYPDLIVPAGVTKDGLPVTISFFGQAFTEPKLIGYGYDFEQATHARILPKTTPLLPGDSF